MTENAVFGRGWHECRGIATAERYNTVSVSALSHVWGGWAFYDCIVADPDGRSLPGVLADVRGRRNLHRVLLSPEETAGRILHLQTRYPAHESLANLSLDRLAREVLAPVVNGGATEAVAFAPPCGDPRAVAETLAAAGMDFALWGDDAAYRAALGRDPVVLGYALSHFGRSFPLLGRVAGLQPRVSWRSPVIAALEGLARRDLEAVSARSAPRANALAALRLVRRGVRECSALRAALGMSKAAFSRLAGVLEARGLVLASPNRRFACLTPRGARLAAHGPEPGAAQAQPRSGKNSL